MSLAQRSAFEARPAVSLAEWHRVAAHASATAAFLSQGKFHTITSKGGGSQANSSTASSTSSMVSMADTTIATASVYKRMSPSLQHLKLLHQMQAKTVVRQLDFSPSTGLDSDLFLGAAELWNASMGGDRQQKLAKFQSYYQQLFDDGRYRSIDPVAATVAALPVTPPVLSNKKPRLPMRSDVGFPRAQPHEIEMKQQEILHETEWEEASPRLVVLVTSDDLGKVVQTEDGGVGRRKFLPEHVEWNGGGLDGIPYAGRELIQAKERNARYFGQPSTGLAHLVQPNPYSILAPPLDASYSASQGWRPRPFHDRAPGLQYVLACPVNVSFGVGNIEPLICSLTLYSLPTGRTTKKGEAWGKMSEEFWFPAGDWTGKIQLDAAQTKEGTMDESLIQYWLNRKHKGIFSYDPLSLSGGTESLYVVLQVFQLAHQNGAACYLARPKKQKENIMEKEIEKVRQQSNLVFEQFGTRLRTPLCFGLAPLHSFGELTTADSAATEWPSGVRREVKLFAFPCELESQEEFVARLSQIADALFVQGLTEALPVDIDSKSTGSDGIPPVATTESFDGMKRKRGVTFLFRSNKKDKGLATANDKIDMIPNALIDGGARVFVSQLPVDFLQSMLTTPAEMIENGTNGSDLMPRLLTDVSGDCAVILDPNQAQSSEGTRATKRSNLLRLPVPAEAAGYVSASEFREVLRLPARPEKHYDVDYGFSYRSLLNLLYLYPRALRRPVDKSCTGQFTIRTRLVQTSILDEKDSGITNATLREMRAFHDPVPWTGMALVDEVYTSLVMDVTDSLTGTDDLKLSISFKDEIKLRLPAVLDGCCSLQFTLFSVVCSASGMSLLPIEETMIPLSSSTSRDNGPGGRVATVIPNGNHRLKLGEFVLSIETRLVSATHVGDPAVATVLRDFPAAKDCRYDDEDAVKSSTAVSSTGEGTVIDVVGKFPSVLSAASEATVVAHFEMLIHLHIGNLVKPRQTTSQQCRESDNVEFLMGVMKSLFEIFRKVKLKFRSSTGSGRQQLRSFIKASLDLLDEGYFSSISCPKGSEDESLEKADGLIALRIDPSDSQEDATEEVDTPAANHEGAIRRKRNNRPGSSQHEQRVSRIVGALGPSSVPFSRIAYGASKLDRMRIEAELKNDGGDRFAYFFDDDETVATAQTYATATERRISGIRDDKAVNQEDASSSNSIVRSAVSSTPDAPRDDIRQGGGAEFANRVKSVAQVMLAPCVGPSLSNILAGARSASPSQRTGDEKKEDSILKGQELGSSPHTQPVSRDFTMKRAIYTTLCSLDFFLEGAVVCIVFGLRH